MDNIQPKLQQLRVAVEHLFADNHTKLPTPVDPGKHAEDVPPPQIPTNSPIPTGEIPFECTMPTDPKNLRHCISCQRYYKR